MSNHLLIIGCSNRKLNNIEPLLAIQRYDGINYRVIRKLQREGNFPTNLDIIIISAKYGFLDSQTQIEYYDQPMTEKRALELRQDISNNLKECIQMRMYEEIFVNIGKNYLLTLDGFDDNAPNKINVIYASGRIGERAKQMKEWLCRIKSK